MEQVKITFSNNETIIIKEGDLLIPITYFEDKGKIYSTMKEPFEIWSHVHDGLIPSLTELFFNGQYFYFIDDKETIYNVTSIVKVEIV